MKSVVHALIAAAGSLIFPAFARAAIYYDPLLGGFASESSATYSIDSYLSSYSSGTITMNGNINLLYSTGVNTEINTRPLLPQYSSTFQLATTATVNQVATTASVLALPPPTPSLDGLLTINSGSELTSGVVSTMLFPTTANLQALIIPLKSGLGSINTSILPQLAGATINVDSYSTVPEPSTLMLMGLSVACLAASRRFARYGV